MLRKSYFLKLPNAQLCNTTFSLRGSPPQCCQVKIGLFLVDNVFNIQVKPKTRNNRIRIKKYNAQAFVGAADNSLTDLGTFASRSEKKGGLGEAPRKKKCFELNSFCF